MTETNILKYPVTEQKDDTFLRLRQCDPRYTRKTCDGPDKNAVSIACIKSKEKGSQFVRKALGEEGM